MTAPKEITVELTTSPQTHRLTGEAQSVRVAVDVIGEISIPRSAFGSLQPGDTFSFFVTVHRTVNGQRVEAQRLGPITVTVPGPDADAQHWRA